MQKNKNFFNYQLNKQAMEQNKYMKDQDDNEILNSEQSHDDLFDEIPSKPIKS
jgi:hypothetical protein